MNRIYRIIWSAYANTWVAVGETACTRSKASGRAVRKAFLVALIASGLGAVEAALAVAPTDIVPASGNTNAYISANGVPVVNIEKANAVGLSHNRYTSYNVPTNGLVLNNGNPSQLARQSQLAGQVPANINLVQEAKVILNEVVSTNRSMLTGFTEVVGGKADVIVANPNGITCSGCGFINTDRVTLTTGTSNVAGDGSLTGFSVNRGDVLINGAGANLSAQQVFDIVARSVLVDGKINTASAGSLGITTGSNAWNYTGRNVTGIVAGNGAAPYHAIDSTVLGGMYAGRIRIIATEVGVGVRMLGEAAASADDFTLSSAGKIEVQSAISAARDVSIASTSASGSQDIFLNGVNAKLSASRDLALSATSGQINLSEGELYAANNLSLTGATLSDVSVAAKTRFGGVNNTLTTTGAAAINGGVWGAGSVLSGTFDSLSNSGTLQSQGALALNLATSLSNGGNLLAAGALTVRGTDSHYTVSDAGRMQSGGLMDVKGSNGSNGVDITLNSGGILLGNSMDINAGTLSVSDNARIMSSGDMTLAANTLNFGGTTSRIVAATSGTGNAAINLVNGFTNTGAVHSGSNMNFSAPSIHNSNTGGFSALNSLTVNATNGNLDNYGALYAGQALNANAMGTLTNYVGGTMDSGGDINVDTSASYFNATPTFTNNSTVKASGNINIAATWFYNNVSGNLTRTWSAYSYSAVVETDLGNTTENAPADFPPIPASKYWYGAADNPARASIYCAHVISCGLNRWTHTQTWSRQESFANLDTSNIFKPQIVANGTTTIQNFQTGTNLGGVISGSSVNLTTTRGGATFTNDDLTVGSESGTYKQFDNTYWAGVPFVGGTIMYARQIAYEAGTTTIDGRQGMRSNGISYSSGVGAGIFANSGALTATGFSLTNRGSTSVGAKVAANPTSRTVNDTSSAVTLPTNPNGYFVTSPNPTARYLVETNPLFGVGSNSLGSDYFIRAYGYNPETAIKRLGDANYEAYLVRQQLVQQTGNNILKGYGNEAGQIKRLMDQAVDEGKRNGLIFGKAPTADQIANLKTDIVWMVETTVAGQRVLAPVVYLAASTKSAIATGGVISGESVTMNLASLTNAGGAISGEKSLNITSKGDISNTSGTITGGDVAIQSTDGSIRNETLISGSQVGKMASISATGNLNLDAKKDITVLGGEVKAGGDASLAAEGNVTFDTIVTSQRASSFTQTDNGLLGTSRFVSTTTETNIGSSLTAGGNLQIKSGGDATIAGSTVAAGKGLEVDTGGSFNVLARQDNTTTNTETSTTGLGVGGGLFGTERTSTNSFSGKNVGSTITVGGDVRVKARNEMTVQGSNLSITGNGDINAKNGIKILDGLDVERTTTNTVTQTVLKVDASGNSSADAGAQSEASANTSKLSNLNAGANAGANADAGASGTADFKLSETSTTKTQSGTSRSVASNFNVGGNLTARTEGTLTVQGSNVATGGDMSLDAKNVDVLAGRNESFSNTQTTRASVGIYTEGEAKASAGAGAQAKAGTTGVDAGANAGASAQATLTATLGAQTSNEKATGYQLTNTAATLQSGGNLSIKAQESATFVGANVASDGDMNIAARNIVSRAAQDIDVNTSQKGVVTTGLYADANVNLGAEGSVGKGNGANAGAGAEASAGLRVNGRVDLSSEGSVTQQTSSFTSGGNLTRKAQDTITDQGTRIEAAGNIDQSAREIKGVAASNASFSSTSSMSMDVRAGMGAGASAGAEAGLTGVSGSASAGAGIRAKANGQIETASEGSGTAVTSSYKAGGNINSKSEEKTTLIGTQFESGGNTNIEAGSLDFQAARDTTSKSSSSNSLDASLKIDLWGKAGGGVDASFSRESESEKTSTARAGNINSGGNLNIRTTGDASFEGTQIESGGKAAIAAGGSVDFKAARDTSESSSTSIDASVSVNTNKGGAAVSASAGFSQADSASSKAQTGSIKAGDGGISITAAKDANFEGTSLKTTGDTSVDAGGNVNLKAAESTSTSSSFGIKVGLGTSSEKGDGNKTETSGTGTLGANVANGSTVKSTGVSIDSGGGKVAINGSNVVNQEATIKTTGETQVVGNEIKKAATNTEVGFGGGVTLSKTVSNAPKNAPENKPEEKPEVKPEVNSAPQRTRSNAIIGTNKKTRSGAVVKADTEKPEAASTQRPRSNALKTANPVAATPESNKPAPNTAGTKPEKSATPMRGTSMPEGSTAAGKKPTSNAASFRTEQSATPKPNASTPESSAADKG